MYSSNDIYHGELETGAEDAFDGFADMDDLDSAPVRSSSAAEKRFPCQACGGTGKYRGPRVHQADDKCFACNGRGYFKTSAPDRAKAKAKRAQKSHDEHQAKVAAFDATNPGLKSFLAHAASWSEFAASLCDSIAKWGGLSEKQLAAAKSMRAKVEAKQAEKAKQAAAPGEQVGELARVIELFDTAQASGIKRPKLRVGELTLSPAPAHGKNAGCIYVKRGDEYMGKVTAEGQFLGREVAGELRTIAADPLAAAKAYGQRTGACSCCGRELTNHASIELGIGPICAEKWGL